MSVNGRPHSVPGPDRELAPEAITRIVLRPVATSLPLGFLAFGAGTILLTALELRWVPPAQSTTLMVMVLVLAVGALRSKPLFGVLLLIGACRFVLTGLYEVGLGGTGLEQAETEPGSAASYDRPAPSLAGAVFGHDVPGKESAPWKLRSR